MAASENSRAAGRAAFQFPAFVLFQTARYCIVLANEMQSVAIGWQVYEISKRPLDLGLVGLAQFLPGIAFFLPAGHTVDRVDRRRLLMACFIGFGLCSALLLHFALRGITSPRPIYVVA